YGTALPPHRTPVPIEHPADRIGDPYFRCRADKVVAVIPTDCPDRNTLFREPDAVSTRIGEHVAEFFRHEIRMDRLPAHLLPLQSGVGNIGNAVLATLDTAGFRDLTAYTEVLQDSMLRMLANGSMGHASATAYSLGPQALQDLLGNLDYY